MVGIVESIGAEVEDIKIGDRVFVNPTVCKRNGMISCDMAGAFSEYVHVEDAAYGYNLLQLKDDVSFDEAVLIEPLGVATRGKNIIGVKAHEHVVVYGAGTIGLCALSALVNQGVTNPVVIDFDDNRLEYVKKLGGTPFNPSKGQKTEDFLSEHFGRVMNPFGFTNVDVDAFIDCAGAKGILSEIVSMAKKSVRISVVAVHKQNEDLPLTTFGGNEIVLRGSCGYDNGDILEAFNSINEKRTCISEIVTHHFKIDEINKAFETACDQKTAYFIKCLTHFRKYLS